MMASQTPVAPSSIAPTPTAPPDDDPLPAADGGRWGRIPAWWLGHPDIDADGLAVLAALSTYANARGECWPSQATLATALKRSRSTVNRILGQLAEAKVIEMQPRRSASGGRLSCLYRLRLVPGDGVIASESAQREAVRPRDTVVASADSPRSPVRQEQPDSEQTPDSLPTHEATPAQTVSADWTPSDDDLTWARSRFAGIDLGRHVEGFLLRCQAHGYRYRDAGAAWKAWLAQDVAAGKAPLASAPAGSGGATPGGAARPLAARGAEKAAEQRLGAWMAAAARLNAAGRPAGPQPWR
ncbi:helix-turn-helix domain-containing protein [Azospirillum rugosum]|uniref:Helix-turn-helix domain-containing protein n=1 Tax=Azospirillum rugosum TaxID=416170 RepID=A0ABS4SKB8_9PROT|nr:helix-turn-helix domain-containing protein [Azospirillum rugosum]MBP2292932.1 hypothetical protein [Azospirillum rugosum]MDQ0529316.1 hypothetical protein [Azospirillum rugosum]